MQLTDAEIREILIRRKKEKIRRQKRRRRRTILILLLLIILIFAAVKVVGHLKATGRLGSDQQAAADTSASRGIIFIDPGHGGDDPGSDDGNGRDEKDDTLKLALAVRDELVTRGFTVEMSRTEDETVDRTVRGQMANECGAQLFVSIHRNKANTDGNGVEGFIPMSNDSNSRLLGENIMHALAGEGFTERTIRAGTLNDENEDYEENAAAVMPSVLIEVGFLSSDYDNDLFDNNIHGNARAIAKAIDYTFMAIYDPTRAAEVASQEEFASEAAGKTIQAFNQVTESISLASNWISSIDEN